MKNIYLYSSPNKQKNFKSFSFFFFLNKTIRSSIVPVSFPETID